LEAADLFLESAPPLEIQPFSGLAQAGAQPLDFFPQLVRCLRCGHPGSSSKKGGILAHGAASYNAPMPPYERHVFVCENVRPAEDPRGCCSRRGSPAIRARLKELVREAGLASRIRINSSGCLDQCAHGVTVVVYPEAVWYGQVTLEDVEEIFHSHLLGGRPVERLRLSPKGSEV
jgi:(2Fe-2S) ferredoxin